jgi:hypothetical protein
LYLGSMVLPRSLRSLRKTVPTAMVACVVAVAGHFGGESQFDDSQLNLIAPPSNTHAQEVAGIPVSGMGARPAAIPAPIWPVDYRLDVGPTKIIVTRIAGLGPLTPTSLPAFYKHEQTTKDQSVRVLRKPPIVPVGRRCVGVRLRR